MSSMIAVGAPPLVEEFAITVAAAALFGYLAQRVGLVSIVGFLVAGVVIGPNALGWIDDLDRFWDCNEENDDDPAMPGPIIVTSARAVRLSASF